VATSVTTIRRNNEAGRAVFVSPETRRQAARPYDKTPSKRSASAVLIALAALSAWPVWAADEHHTVVPAEEVTWSPGPPTLPSGAQLAVLFGSPAEEGPSSSG